MTYPWELQAWGNGRQQLKSISPGHSLNIEELHVFLALCMSWNKTSPQRIDAPYMSCNGPDGGTCVYQNYTGFYNPDADERRAPARGGIGVLPINSLSLVRTLTRYFRMLSSPWTVFQSVRRRGSATHFTQTAFNSVYIFTSPKQYALRLYHTSSTLLL